MKGYQKKKIQRVHFNLIGYNPEKNNDCDSNSTNLSFGNFDLVCVMEDDEEEDVKTSVSTHSHKTVLVDGSVPDLDLL